MQYKTMVLELLQQYPHVHNQVLGERTLLPTMELYARELKTSHEAWKDRLNQALPGSNQDQIASEALEVALWELGYFLRLHYPPDDSEPPTAEAAMASNRGHSPPA